MSRSRTASIALTEAAELTRTGDLWLFRGRSPSDRAIQGVTNSPVNHVGMAVAIDDLPPLLWHAEMGRALPDVWSGTQHRGAQLHDLTAAVRQWTGRYRQRVWLRQLEPPVSAAMEDAALQVIARLDGMPFPSTGALASRWLLGRFPLPTRMKPAAAQDDSNAASDSNTAGLVSAYCAEVVAMTYQAMGLLPKKRPNYYDPGKFWSGDQLQLASGYGLGGEIFVAADQ